MSVEFLSSVDSLERRRADLVPEGFVEDYVALHWLEWKGGGLHLTVTGADMRKQLLAELY